MQLITRILCTLWVVGCMAFAVAVSGSSSSGCAASSQHMKTELPLRPVAMVGTAERPASQPATAGDIAAVVAQQSGAFNALATATAKLAATVDTKVNASATGVGGDVAGYRSEFGVGAVVAVCAAMTAALGVVWVVIKYSHVREVKRIETRGVQQQKAV